MKGDTLQKRVMDKLGDDVLPSKVDSELKFCSDKLAKVTTIEDFEDIMHKYRLLEDRLSRFGLFRRDFEDIIVDMKKEL